MLMREARQVAQGHVGARVRRMRIVPLQVARVAGLGSQYPMKTQPIPRYKVRVCSCLHWLKCSTMAWQAREGHVNKQKDSRIAQACSRDMFTISEQEL